MNDKPFNPGVVGVDEKVFQGSYPYGNKGP